MSGVEEADHAHWLNNPKAFKEHFPGKEFTDVDPATRNYDEDPVEKHATKMMGKAIKPLSISRSNTR